MNYDFQYLNQLCNDYFFIFELFLGDLKLIIIDQVHKIMLWIKKLIIFVTPSLWILGILDYPKSEAVKLTFEIACFPNGYLSGNGSLLFFFCVSI